MRGFADTRQLQMKVLVIALWLAAIVAQTSPVGAQAEKDRTVEQYLCKDVMRESGENRDVAIAFLHGFLLGKSGKSNFNVDTLRKQSDQFIEACLEKPGERAINVMATVKG
jgi:hypothetical protein